ncbi:hypothetical protein FDP41_005195 [Naegleria fowleri]|uniref:RGS domain-containing protein n=1 Tax=Naegleria fowleri TaxID=5763 RepID=A0A6A5BNX8_NAEFO|nr:uncharacterized protein FDP41_005195 [Naegleria fowleri]KAF0975868.1 hypothetical protein FDP41_005195 [Naegleria fowleri]
MINLFHLFIFSSFSNSAPNHRYTTTTTTTFPSRPTHEHNHIATILVLAQEPPADCVLPQDRAFLLTTLHDFKFSPNLYGTWRLKYSNDSTTIFTSPSSSNIITSSESSSLDESTNARTTTTRLVPCPDLFEITTISVSATVDRMTYFAVSIDILHNQTEFESHLWGVSYQPQFRTIFFELFAFSNITRVIAQSGHSSYHVEMINQHLVSNETLPDGSYKSLLSGSQVYMKPLLMRKKFYGFEYTVEMKLQDLFHMFNESAEMHQVNDDDDKILSPPPPSIQTFLTSLSSSSNHSSSSVNVTHAESIFKLKMLVSKYDLPFAFPLMIQQPLGTNSILFCSEISLNTIDQTTLPDLDFQKSLIQAHHAISTVIVIINATLSIIVLTLLVIFRKTKPRESRGYLPYVIFIQIFVNFVRLLLQTYWGDEFLLIVFIFSTLVLLCFSYLMYFLNTLVVFYKRKVYNDWYNKMKRESMDKQKKQKNNNTNNNNHSSSNPNTPLAIAVVKTNEQDETTTNPFTTTTITHRSYSDENDCLKPSLKNVDISGHNDKSHEETLRGTSMTTKTMTTIASSSANTLHSNSSGNLLLPPQSLPSQQDSLPHKDVIHYNDMMTTTAITFGVQDSSTTASLPLSQQFDLTLENSSIIAKQQENHQDLHLGNQGHPISSRNQSHSISQENTELSMSHGLGSLWWVKSRRVKICSTLFVILLVSLSLVIILPVLFLTNESTLESTVLIVLGFYFLVASAMAIGALSLDLAWNWKRFIKKCEWKKYFFRNDPLYYRLELVIHFFSIFQFIASVVVLFTVRDRVDNISLLNNKTYSSSVPAATFASLPIEFTAVVFEILASGGGFICFMTVYEKYKLWFHSEQEQQQEEENEEDKEMYASFSQHVISSKTNHQEFPNSELELDKNSPPWMVKFRTNIYSPMLELLGDDLCKLFVDEKGFELLRLFSKSEFSMENVAFIHDMEKIYTLLFCDIHESRKLSSGASPSSLSKSCKPTLRQNLTRETIERAKLTVCDDFYNLYVSENAKLSVNFSNQSKMIFNKWKLNGWNDEYIKSDDFFNDLDYVTLDVVKNVRDTFRRFQLTPSYKEWKMHSRKNIQALKSALRQAKKGPLTSFSLNNNNGNGGQNEAEQKLEMMTFPSATSTSPMNNNNTSNNNNNETTLDVNTVKVE